jgi:PD-(D/E)XK nuclease superfamily
MAITLITGPANAGKAERVMAAIRGHAAAGGEPLLIVPTRADVAHYRRELAGEGTLMGVQVQRFSELQAVIARRAGESAPALGELARERVLALIAARQGPGAASPGFTRALARLVAELAERRVSPARLRAGLLQAAGAGSPATQLADVYDAYLLALRRLGRRDSGQLALHALDALARQPALWGSRPVLFYGFDDLTRLQLDAIETLGLRVGAEVTVSLTYEPGRAAFAGRAATFHALAPLAARHERLHAQAAHYAPRARATLAHLERSLFEEDVRRAPSSPALRLIAGADERDELELVAAQIAALLDEGMEPEGIAVVARLTPAGAELLEEVFARAGVPFALPRRRRFADSSIGAALLGLLRCAAAGEQGDANGHSPGGGPAAGHAGDLLTWLRAPGVLSRPELADGLEATLRRTGAAGAGQALELWEQRHWPLGALEKLRLAQARGPAALAAHAERQLVWLFGVARRRQASVLEPRELCEAQALRAGRRALAELRELARVAPDLAPGDAGSLAEALQGLEHPGGERPSPSTVAVLDPLALRARRVQALFVCRLQEGVLPSAGTVPALLSEEERRRLAQASGVVLADHGDALAAERYLFYAAASRPQQLLVLSWHEAGEDGRAAARSLFVDDVCDLFEEDLPEKPLRSAAPARASADEPQVAPAGPPAAREGGIEPLRDRELLADLAAHTWSPSSLGVWRCCPVRWLVERMLRAQDLDPDPEPLARGGLAHSALARTLEELRSRTGSARITPARLGLARELLGEALARGEAQFALSAAPERRPGVRRRLRADLERYLEHAAATAADEEGAEAQAALHPEHLELEFGFAGASDARSDLAGHSGAPLPALELGGGVRLRGRIDRIDVNGRGQAVVYDYKGANVAAPDRWVAQGDLQAGLYMRAAETLLGLQAVGGFYQPLSGSDLRARGVLDIGSGVELECVGGDAREPGEVRELLEGVLAAAREAATEAARGELQPRPQTCAYKQHRGERHAKLPAEPGTQRQRLAHRHLLCQRDADDRREGPIPQGCVDRRSLARDRPHSRHRGERARRGEQAEGMPAGGGVEDHLVIAA